jgi:outer membrane protein TolC
MIPLQKPTALSRQPMGMTAVILLLLLQAPRLSLASSEQPQTLRLSMRQAVEIALRNSTSLAAAKESLASAQSRVVIAQSAQRPQVFAGAEYTRGSSEGPLKSGLPRILGSRLEDREVSLRFRENLFDSFQTKTRVQQAKAQQMGAEKDLESVRQRVALDALVAYYGVLRAASLSEVAKAALDRTKREQQRLESLVEVGEAARKEIPRAKAEVAAAEVDAIAAENAVENAVSVLRNVLGLPQTTQIILTDTLGSPEPAPDLEQLIEEAYRRRPDLRQAELQVEAAKLSLKLAQIQAGVTIGAEASYDVRLHPHPIGRSWNLGVSASYPLFDSGASKARVKDAETALATAQARLEQLRRDIALQVKQAHIQVEEARARLQAAERGVEAARESLAAAEGSLAAQVGIFLEVVAAQVGLTQAESRVVQALYDYNVARAQLEFAVGRLQ